MKKEELETLNKLCKVAHAKGAATQFILRGLSKDQAKEAVKKTAAVVDNFYKVAAYRKGVIKEAIRKSITK